VHQKLERAILRPPYTTKVHALVDGLGNPLKFLLTGGQVHDSIAAPELLETVDLANVNVIVDKAYGAEKLRGQITLAHGAYTSPPKENSQNPEDCDYFTYRERHLIEDFLIK